MLVGGARTFGVDSFFRYLQLQFDRPTKIGEDQPMSDTVKQPQPRSHIVDTTGNRLQQLLDQGKLSRAEAARRGGVAVEVVNRILGQKPVRRVKLLAVAAGLNVGPEEIIHAWDGCGDG